LGPLSHIPPHTFGIRLLSAQLGYPPDLSLSLPRSSPAVTTRSPPSDPSCPKLRPDLPQRPVPHLRFKHSKLSMNKFESIVFFPITPNGKSFPPLSLFIRGDPYSFLYFAVLFGIKVKECIFLTLSPPDRSSSIVSSYFFSFPPLSFYSRAAVCSFDSSACQGFRLLSFVISPLLFAS